MCLSVRVGSESHTTVVHPNPFPIAGRKLAVAAAFPGRRPCARASSRRVRRGIKQEGSTTKAAAGAAFAMTGGRCLLRRGWLEGFGQLETIGMHALPRAQNGLDVRGHTPTPSTGIAWWPELGPEKTTEPSCARPVSSLGRRLRLRRASLEKSREEASSLTTDDLLDVRWAKSPPSVRSHFAQTIRSTGA